MKLTHLDRHGRAQMVDVTAKSWTRRVAVARANVEGSSDFTDVIAANPHVIVQARAAGIGAAKRTWDLIPLCHPIQLVDVDIAIACTGSVLEIETTTEVLAPTGVEMEALTGCCVAGLVLVEFLRHVDPDVSLTDVALLRKEGGRSGTWERPG